MKLGWILLVVVFVVFTIFSVMVVADEGYLGFLSLADSQWGVQVFLDLVIALTMFAIWMFPDAKARGIAAWPYAIAICFLGSIGAMAYLIHRHLKSAQSL